jgi:hypothetical protein
MILKRKYQQGYDSGKRVMARSLKEEKKACKIKQIIQQVTAEANLNDCKKIKDAYQKKIYEIKYRQSKTKRNTFNLRKLRL